MAVWCVSQYCCSCLLVITLLHICGHSSAVLGCACGHIVAVRVLLVKNSVFLGGLSPVSACVAFCALQVLFQQCAVRRGSWHQLSVPLTEMPAQEPDSGEQMGHCLHDGFSLHRLCCSFQAPCSPFLHKPSFLLLLLPHSLQLHYVIKPRRSALLWLLLLVLAALGVAFSLSQSCKFWGNSRPRLQSPSLMLSASRHRVFFSYLLLNSFSSRETQNGDGVTTSLCLYEGWWHTVCTLGIVLLLSDFFRMPSAPVFLVEGVVLWLLSLSFRQSVNRAPIHVGWFLVSTVRP